jgi:hypothetical protein
MRILATVTRPSSGRILWNDSDIRKDPDALRSVLGYLPQDFGVYPNLSAIEFLDHLAAVKGIPAVAAKKRIGELLELVNLTDAARRPLAGYSGGMRQRAGIAQALLNDPQLLIVDAPTAGLAVLFETLPIVRGGVGSILWFFVWSIMGIALPELSRRHWLDPMGLMTVADSMMAGARKFIPGYKNSFSLTIADKPSPIVETFRWHGVPWTSEAIFLRAGWTAVAFLIVMLAALFSIASVPPAAFFLPGVEPKSSIPHVPPSWPSPDLPRPPAPPQSCT